MTDLDMWSGIVGFAVPPLVAVFVQSAWPAWARAVFAFVVCVAGGGVTAAFTGYLHGMSPARSVLVVLFSALTFYRVFWHPSQIAPMIEKKTNLSAGEPIPRGADPSPRIDRAPSHRRPAGPDLDPVHHRYPPR
jgi:hypothetical protein